MADDSSPGSKPLDGPDVRPHAASAAMALREASDGVVRQVEALVSDPDQQAQLLHSVARRLSAEATRRESWD